MQKEKIVDRGVINVDRKRYDLNTMSNEELFALKLEIEQGIADIRGQIEAASAKFNQTGEAAESGWFISARKALRVKGIQAQAIQMFLGERKRKAILPLGEYFIKAARSSLPPNTFQFILDAARHERDKDQVERG